MKSDGIKLTASQEELLIRMYRLERALNLEEMTEQEKNDLSVLTEHGYVERADEQSSTTPTEAHDA